MRVAVAALMLMLLVSVAVPAQLCVGNPTFAIAHFQGGVGIDLDDLAHRYTLEARAGYRRGFVAAEYGIKSWDMSSLNGESRVIAGTVGVGLGARKSKLEICPLLNVSWASGPHDILTVTNNQVTGWDYSERAFSWGFSAGYLLVRAQLWDIVPTASLTIGNGDPKITSAGASMSAVGDFCCGWNTFGALRLGVGLGFSDELTFIPSISLPLGGMSRRTYGIRAALRLGKGI